MTTMEVLDIIQSGGIVGLLIYLVRYLEAERKLSITNEESAEKRFVAAVEKSTEVQVKEIKEAHVSEKAVMRELLEASKGVNNDVISMLKEELEKCATDRREQRVAILRLANEAGQKVLPEQTEPSLRESSASINQHKKS